MILLEYVRVHQLVLLGGFEVHAVLVAECLLHVLEVLVQEDVLEHADGVVEVVVFLVVA